MNCINRSLPEYKQLLQKTGLNPFVLEIKISKWQEKTGNEDSFPSVGDIMLGSNVNFVLKVVDILSSDKAKQVFEKGEKNKWDLNKILTDLTIPKEQKQLIIDIHYNILNKARVGIIGDIREEIITDLLANYSYAIEINTATKNEIGVKESYNPETEEINIDYIEPDVDYIEEYDEEGNIIGVKPVLSERGKKQLKERPTQYYSNMTVPGGTNYTENEISTPLIIPSIKGHAQFATDKGIGWFRSDEQTVKGTFSKETKLDNLNIEDVPNTFILGETTYHLQNDSWYMQSQGEESVNMRNVGLGEPEILIAYKSKLLGLTDISNDLTGENYSVENNTFGTPTKTRRILEVQSDLFQKWRNNFEFEGNKYTIRKNENTSHYYKNNSEINANEYVKVWNIFLETYLNNSDAFTKLLQKDNNWVTFFVKSIIQDSAKKGYEKVLFPTGNTASKVEGHTTLEEFKKQKEDRLKQIEGKEDTEDTYKTLWLISPKGNSGGQIFNTKEEAEKEFSNPTNPYIKENISLFELKSKKEFVKGIKYSIERNQLKQELERVETEGFGALKPIYNFYENTIEDVLINHVLGKESEFVNYEFTHKEIKYERLNDKGIYTKDGNEISKKEFVQAQNSVTKQDKKDGLFKEDYYINSKGKITDEYGNTWNEIEIKPEENLKSILLQKSQKIKSPVDTRLNKALEPFIQSLGLTVESVLSIKDRDGNKINAIAAADLSVRAIQIVEGKAGKDTLTEEVSHFLVELLKQSGNPLYKSMMSEIESYNIYQEVVQEYENTYKGNVKKLKEEAIGKLITKIAIRQFDQNSKIERANNWFNKVFNFFKKLFAGSNKESLKEFSSFSEAAKMMFERTDLKLENSNENQDLRFQLDAQKQVTDKLDATAPLYIKKGSDRYTIIENGTEREVKKRTSDKIKELDKKRGFKERTALEKELDAKMAEFGTNGHADLENILSIKIAERTGTVGEVKVVKTKEVIYTLLEEYATKLMETIPLDSKIYLEKKLYDPTKDSAGTVDLLIIDSKGRAEIFDFKFMNLFGKSEIPWFKKENWEMQMSDYKQKLKNVYGVTEFLRTRMIPFSVDYTQAGIAKSIKIGGVTKSIENSILNQVSVDEELTGIDSFDKLLKVLYEDRQKLKDLIKSKNIYKLKEGLEKEKAKALIIKKLEAVENSIEDILLEKDLSGFLTQTNYTLNRINNNKDNATAEQLVEFKKDLKFISEHLILVLSDLFKSEDFKYKEEIFNIVGKSKLLDADIIEKIKDKAVEISQNAESIIPQKEIGWFSRMFKTLSQQQHPVLKAFYQLVLKSKANTRTKMEEILEQIKTSVNKVQEFQKARGITGEKIFDFMLSKTSNGKLQTVSIFSKEYFKEKELQAINYTKGTKEEKIKAANWFKNNTKFDEKTFNETLNNKLKSWKYVYANDVDSEQKIENRKQSFIKLFGNNATGMSNKRNKFVTPLDIHYSDEYKYILNNKELKDFYDLWTSNTKLFMEYIGMPYDSRFMWNVQKDLLDRVLSNGFSSLLSVDALTDGIKVKAGLELGMVDEKTGKPLMSIPVFYTKQELIKENDGNYKYNTDNTSTDLGRVLALVASMAYNHKHMAEIETSSKILQLNLEMQDTILTDGNGKSLKNKYNGKLQTIIGSSSNLEMFNDNFNYYVYGVKNKTKDVTYGKDNQFSAIATFDKVAKWFTTKSLTFNIISNVANLSGGNLNGRIEGAKNRFFNNTQYSKSLYKLIPKRDSKSMASLGFFDLVDGDNFWKKANDLSVNNLTKHLTYENLMIGQTASDKMVRNATLLAMMQSHTIEEGKIVKIGQKGGINLLDLVNIENGKFSIEGATNEELEKFRNKTLDVSTSMLGANTSDDINLMRLTVAGRALMMFRNWIPRMAQERIGKLSKNENLGVYDMGRYLTFWQMVTEKQFLPLITDTIRSFGLLGYGGNLSSSMEERAKLLYEKAKSKALDKGDKFDITESEFVQLHYQNLRANCMEIQLLAIMYLTLFALKGDDDDDDKKNKFRKYFTRQLERNISELRFFTSVPQFEKIIKSPVPILTVLKDLGSLGKAISFETVETITGNETLTKKNEIKKYGFKMFPILNGFESFLSVIDEDYNKADITDSRGK